MQKEEITTKSGTPEDKQRGKNNECDLNKSGS